MLVKNKNLFFIILTVFAVLLTIFIFNNSSKTGVESQESSDYFVDKIDRIIFGFNVSIKPETLSIIIRKSAHFLEYFLLSGLAFSALYLKTSNAAVSLLSIPYCLAVAITDEFYFQASASGRSPEWRDFFIDASGAVLAVVIIILIAKMAAKRRKGR